MSSPPRERRVYRALDGIVLLDKPLGLSSNTALQRVRWLLRAAKAGHTGALDPLATGVLPLCFGEATKLCSLLLDADKTYIADVKLGETTCTGDAEGEVVCRSDASGVTREHLEAVLPRLLGDIEQVPPMYSALKRDGVPLYQLAREGIEVERAARTVHIHSLRVLDFTAGHFCFEVRCSKGTYVRTLAEDWAALLGQAAHLTALRRTALGSLQVADAVSLDQLEIECADDATPAQRLLPLEHALCGYPRVTVDAAAARRLAQGQAVPQADGPVAEVIGVLDHAGTLLGIARAGEDRVLRAQRWLSGAAIAATRAETQAVMQAATQAETVAAPAPADVLPPQGLATPAANGLSAMD